MHSNAYVPPACNWLQFQFYLSCTLFKLHLFKNASFWKCICSSCLQLIAISVLLKLHTFWKASFWNWIFSSCLQLIATSILLNLHTFWMASFLKCIFQKSIFLKMHFPKKHLFKNASFWKRIFFSCLQLVATSVLPKLHTFRLWNCILFESGEICFHVIGELMFCFRCSIECPTKQNSWLLSIPADCRWWKSIVTSMTVPCKRDCTKTDACTKIFVRFSDQYSITKFLEKI